MNATQTYYSAKHVYEDWAPSLLSLGLRLWIATIFFKSGLTKIASWDTTLALFEYEYQVPVLSPVLAAYLATAAELALPVLLVLGLLTRPASLALFVFNLAAVISYPDISDAGIKDHLYWGVMITVVLAIGGGIFSLDRIWQRFRQNRMKHVA